MSKRLYSFGPFELNTEEQVLLREGQFLPLKPKAFQMLLVLVENSGRLVCKDELMKQVWSDSFVEESNVAVGICKLRKLLGGESNGHTYIETIPRRGYRFVASVTEVSLERSGQGAAASVCRVALDGYANSGEGTIAVLPFKSIGATGGEYLGLGMADALITRLTNLRQVTVRPTSSTRKYDAAEDPIQVGRELSVEWVLDGSVQKAGKRIRVTAQLLNVASGVLMWAEKFDEKFTNIFSVEDSISERLVNALALKLTGKDRRLLAKRHTESVDAYEAYLRGQYFFDKRTTEGCKKGIQYFERAIKFDPNYALAYTGLAGCYIILASYTAVATREAKRKAEAALLRALEIDSELAEAHASLAHLKTRQWDWIGAEREFIKAIELSPNYATAYAWFAIYLSEIGCFDKALTSIKRAKSLDPLSCIITCTSGSILYLGRRYDEAIEEFHATLELDENFALAHTCLGLALEAKGEYSRAAAQYHLGLGVLGRLPELVACLGHTDALAGRIDKATRAIEELKHWPERYYVHPYSIALIYTALADKDQAFHWLERAYAESDEDLTLFKVDPRLESLRRDPRFISLLHRVGLALPTI